MASSVRKPIALGPLAAAEERQPWDRWHLAGCEAIVPKLETVDRGHRLKQKAVSSRSPPP